MTPAALALTSTSPSATFTARKFSGVNLAGNNRYLGATTWPTSQGLAYYLGKNMNCFRIMTLWENLQPTIGGALNTTNMNGLTATINQITQAGAYAMIDCHNYCRWSANQTEYSTPGGGSIIGESSITAGNFASFWATVAASFAGNSKVIFNLTNEPHDQNTTTLAATYNTVIAAIRSAGANNLIFLDGNTWSGAHSWVNTWDGSTPNAVAMLNVTDSANNFAFDTHQYLDTDGSGQSQTCVAGFGSDRLIDVTGWARQNGKRLFLGEFGGGANSGCNTEMAALLAYTRSNSDVWLGWTYFGAYAGQPPYNTPDTFWANVDPTSFSSPVDDPRMPTLTNAII